MENLWFYKKNAVHVDCILFIKQAPVSGHGGVAAAHIVIVFSATDGIGDGVALK